MSHAGPVIRSHAKDMRRAPTEVEARVWQWLRDRRFSGFKFRRQVPIGPYILDFYCPTLHLAIELDGAGHNDASMSEYDSKRTIFLSARGIEVLRIPNELTQAGGEYAIACIQAAIAKRSPK
ncbi:MAG TPA: endonuclease domain-containing protein [Thermoanaerobaculia bacterium]|nr:endonuclease domain-containing protein [Thermoanaerobaculia bacterium]